LASPSARRGTSFTRADRVGFEEAMVYYHVDAAIRFIESLGYTGGSRIFKTPLRANAGFGDYLAASFFAKRKRHEFQTLVMIWDAFETSEETPRLRTVDSTLTCESFDHDADADEHENGRIWSATLWDVRGCFKRPKDGDRAIIESHFQLDGFTTFARGARAILDADRNLYKGVHAGEAARRVFRRRSIGPVE
jgi:hypothetical protein